MSDVYTCRTCNNSDPRPPREWHHMQHPFRGPEASASSLNSRPDEPAASVGVVSMPFDPVLRQALIDKGVLTVQDLRDAEAQILAVTGRFQQAMTEATDGSGDGGRQQAELHDQGRVTLRDGGTGIGGVADLLDRVRRPGDGAGIPDRG